MANDEVWTATVTKKSRGLLDGSNMYRRVTITTDDGRTEKIRVGRELWKQLSVGDRLIKDAGQEPRIQP